MAKKPTTASRKKLLTKLKKNLVGMKTELYDEIEAQLKAEREGNQDRGMDAVDLASEERDREINFILSNHDRAKIKQIDDALMGNIQ